MNGTRRGQGYAPAPGTGRGELDSARPIVRMVTRAARTSPHAPERAR
jgi:hypothetical protein